MHLQSIIDYTNNSKVDQLEDIDAARCRVEASLRCHLDDRYEDHAYLVKNTMWRQRTCYERDLRPHTDDTTVQWDTSPRLKFEQSKSPFGKMQDIQSMLAKSNVPNTKEMGQEIFAKATSKGSTTKTTSSVPAITYVPEKLQIPPFKEYVSLKTNILADNESKILTLPYLGDNEPEHRQQVLRNDLPTRYEILHDENALLDLRSEQCHYYYDTIEAFLGDLGLKWDTMIYWLLSSATDLRHKNRISEGHAEFEEILQDRAPYDKEFFCRDGNNLEATLFESGSDHWRNLLTQLQEPSVGNLRLIAIAGAAIMRHCSFSPWYMVKRCKTMQGYVHAKLERAKDVPDFTFRDILCRICHEHDCVFHGQIREDPKGGSLPDMHRSPSPSDTSQDHAHEDESDVEIAHYDTDNSDVEKVINYKLPVNSGPPDDNTQSAFSAPRHPVPPAGPFRPKWWECNTETSWEKCKPFVPCSHHGSCVEAKCRCFRENITCEKTCKCSLTCNRRFPGCKCAQVPNKRTCSTATGCLCVKFERECDADLCGTCGATEVLDPLNRYDEEVLQDRCKNVAVQRGVSKKTLLGKSEVHGFGLYAGEDIYKGEHIGEYVGEIISSSESQRRGIVYHYEKNMYLFQLNEEQEVDATHMGNKLRFINNANKNLSNCSCRVVFCNTVFRVALNANSDIKAGTELFFHYNYPEDMTKHFKQPKSKVVAVKQVVKLNSKDKTNTASSRSSSNNDSYRPAVDNPRMLAATAKARAAKKAKREAMLAEQGLGAALFKNASRSSKPARKSAGYSSLLPTSREWSARGRPRKARGAASRDESAASGSVADYSRGVSARRRRSATLVVQETDDEDDEFRLGSTQGEDDDVAKPNAEDSGHDSQAVTGAQDATTQSSSRLRTRATVPASVMAVKQVKKKKGGARPGAGRKRKRPLIVNSDDEL
ncbi:hypothetical protein DE146DRAFT_608522 [Phaeosphaeria sp. MPI-PUGE-AT-0046c]|nr:hypothetical protein DE146DRAFT_608522 [Phaeosphaeria sp. MPI-PUGE-AT-0046c]